MDQLSDEQKSQAKQTFNRFVRNIHSVDPENIKREAKDYLDDVLTEREDVPDEVRKKLRIGKHFLTKYYPFDQEQPEDRVALAALQYLLDPWDGVSDVIPERGLADDAFIMSFARTKIQTIKEKHQTDDAGQQEEAGEQGQAGKERDNGLENDSEERNKGTREELDAREKKEGKNISEPLEEEGDEEPEYGDDSRRVDPEEMEETTPEDRVQKRRELIQNGYEVVEANEDLSEVVWYNEQKDERIVGTEQAWDHYESEDDPSSKTDSVEEEEQHTDQEDQSLTGKNEGESAGDKMFNRVLSSITTQPSEGVEEHDENDKTEVEHGTASESSSDSSDQSTAGTSSQQDEDGAAIDLDQNDNEQEDTGQDSQANAREVDEVEDDGDEGEDANADQESGDEKRIEVDDIVDVNGEKRGKVKSAYSHYLEVRHSRSHVELYKRSECEFVRRE